MSLVAGCSGAAPAAVHRRTATPTPSPPDVRVAARPAPTWFAVLRRGSVRWFNSRTAQPLGLRPEITAATITAIGALHDGHSILFAARPRRANACTSIVGRETVRSASRLYQAGVRYLGHLRGVPELIAVSDDSSRVALVLNVPDRPGGACEREQLVVVDLQNGHRQVWTLPSAAGTAGYSGWFVDPVAWSPDGHRLALHLGRCCADGPGTWILDLAGPPGPLLSRAHRVASHEECGDMPYAWTRAGIVSADGGPGCAATSEWLVALDPQTGTASALTRPELPGPVSEISADGTGRHFLVYAADALYRVDDGHVSRVMRLPWDGSSPAHAVW